MNQTKLTLVHSATPRSARATELLRDGTTGITFVPAPGTVRRLWAVGDAAHPATDASPLALVQQPATSNPTRPRPQLAFYRKYTEAMLRRWTRLAMSPGRVPSLLGRELFRGRVTSYRVESFDDAVIYSIDMERCFKKLTPAEQGLVRRIAIQEYSQGEAAGLLGLSLRDTHRRYGAQSTASPASSLPQACSKASAPKPNTPNPSKTPTSPHNPKPIHLNHPRAPFMPRSLRHEWGIGHLTSFFLRSHSTLDTLPHPVSLTQRDHHAAVRIPMPPVQQTH